MEPLDGKAGFPRTVIDIQQKIPMDQFTTLKGCCVYILSPNPIHSLVLALALRTQTLWRPRRMRAFFLYSLNGRPGTQEVGRNERHERKIDLDRFLVRVEERYDVNMQLD